MFFIDDLVFMCFFEIFICENSNTSKYSASSHLLKIQYFLTECLTTLKIKMIKQSQARWNFKSF